MRTEGRPPLINSLEAEGSVGPRMEYYQLRVPNYLKGDRSIDCTSSLPAERVGRKTDGD